MDSKQSNKLTAALKEIEHQFGVGTLAKLARVVPAKSFINTEKYKSIENERLSTLKKLFDKTGRYKPNAIFSAVNEENDLKLIEAILIEEADANLMNEQGQTPLVKAILLKSQSIINLLINYKANVNLPCHGVSPLMLAAQEGLTYIAVSLIKAGADINDHSGDGMTALMLAAREGHADIIELLLSVNVNIKATTVKGATALSIAQQFEHEEVVQLIENG